MSNRFVLTSRSITRGALAYIVAFIYLEPAAFQHFSYVDDIYDVLHIFVFPIILIFRLGDINKNEKNNIPIDIWLSIYYVYLIIITAYNGGETFSVFLQATQFIGFAMYLELIFHNNPSEIYKSICNILFVFNILNFVSILIWPGGLYTTSYFSVNYLFGYANQNINFMLPAMLIILLKHVLYKKSFLQLVVIYFTSIMTAILVWSGASIIVTVSMSAIAFLCIYRKGRIVERYISGNIFNFGNMLIINIAAFIGLVFFNIQYYFEYFVTIVLKKSLTLTGRTTIWERNISLIKKNIIFGYGKESYAKRATKLGFKSNYAAGLHAHNRFLETIYRGGIILESIYAVMLLKTVKSLGKYKHTLAAKLIGVSLFIYMCGMLTEFYDYCIFFFGFMVMAENCSVIMEGNYEK